MVDTMMKLDYEFETFNFSVERTYTGPCAMFTTQDNVDFFANAGWQLDDISQPDGMSGWSRPLDRKMHPIPLACPHVGILLHEESRIRVAQTLIKLHQVDYTSTPDSISSYSSGK